ncbi:MAG: mechanosensitive ion channel [bacterium]
MEGIQEFITSWTGLTEATQGKLFSSLLILLVVGLIRAVIRRVLARRIQDVGQRYYWTRILTYVLVAVTIVLVGRVWFRGVTSLLNYLAVVSAGLVIALHQPVANMAGWLFILWRRPFQVGDRVEIAGTKGDVIDIRLFQFSLLETGNWVQADQSTGRIVHVPNGKVLSEPLANYTKGFQFIWHEIPVLITFESDWKRAEEILSRVIHEEVGGFSLGAEEQIRRTARKYMIYYGKLTPIVYLEVADSGVLLTIRYLVNPRHRRGTEQAIWRSILEAFAAEADIDFAYPTTRYYDNRMEGRPGTRGGGGPPLPPTSE